MTAPIVIADEVTAQGFRLAGARVFTPQPEGLQRVFEQACTEAELVVITTDYARRLPTAQLAAAQVNVRPLVFVIADAFNKTAVADLGHELRAALGVST